MRRAWFGLGIFLFGCQDPIGMDETGTGETDATATTSAPGPGSESASQTSVTASVTDPPTSSEPTTTESPATTVGPSSTTAVDPSTTSTSTGEDTSSSTGRPVGCDEAIIFEGPLEIFDDTDPASLQCIVEITGDLLIQNTQSLISFKSLEHLQRVGGKVRIENNAELASLDGLAGLQIVEGIDTTAFLYIHDNPSLTDISDLQALQHVKLVSIAGCDALTDLTGLTGIIEPGWSLTLVDNADLSSLASLAGITGFSGYLDIGYSPKLADLSPLADILAPDLAGLSISGLPLLTDLQGLESVEALGRLELRDNAGLVDLSGLDGLSSVSDHAWLLDNAKLATLDGLQALVQAGELQISGNPQLATLDGLQTLTQVATLRFEGNPKLASLAALAGLTIISEQLEIGYCDAQGNDALIDLHGLEGLTALGGLSLYQNDALQSITALPQGIGLEYLWAFNNPLLPTPMLEDYVAETMSDPAVSLCNNGGAPATCFCIIPP
ncbi:Receptor L domain-containing protein [Nannocystis exedens]|uniref:Receptor L domain-containing protein n=1 Tax=Nannocystis exedens TaxID=54 RepID=A0A1I2DAE9_9BACT|nr:hypothetical protein [Nannocystis exedens]PCC70645.1 adenylate cyclase [Nannocystis exedens]SFE77093.1 Receptor L domain-containing protein [Nannocystis exedens]